MKPKTFNPLVKLIKGIGMLGSVVTFDKYIDGAEGLNKIKKALITLMDFLPTNLAGILASFTVMIIAMTMVYFYVSGLYRICTFNIYIREFEDKS